MNTLFVKLKNGYYRNSILQFLLSHILILILSLLIMAIGFKTAFDIVKTDTENSYISMFQNSVHILDKELEKIQKLALQISKDESVRNYAEFHKGENGYIIHALEAITNTQQLLSLQNSELIDNSYTYYRGKDLVLYNGSYYRPEIMSTYLTQWGISIDAWKQITLNAANRIPFYQASGHSIEYVFPFSNRLDGDNEGIIVIRLQEQTLKEYLSFMEGYDSASYTIAILDQKNELLWSTQKLPNPSTFLHYASNPEKYYSYGNTGMIWTTSSQTGWKYLLLVPQKQALETLSGFKNMVYFLFGIAVLCGVFIAILTSVKKGKPINTLYRYANSMNGNNDSDIPLGETVSQILSNHQELLDELESQKPALQNAFFHDLVKGEFHSKKQLAWAAQKADIELNGTDYLIAIFELFHGNDFYDIDSQTLEEVHIITQVLQSHLMKLYPRPMVFNKRNYKSSTIIFEITTQKEQVLEAIQSSYHWLLDTYQVETRWGISQLCDDPMLLWKSFEEARKSFEHSNSQNPIVEYSAELENIYDFYLPKIAQEKLRDSICSGHMNEVDSILSILETENLRRQMNRSRFLKLNQRITDLLSDIGTSESQNVLKKKLVWLNELFIAPTIDQKEYFLRFRQVCQFACIQNSEQKKQQRGIMIEHIIQYLQEHYMDSSMGLAQVGTVFHISEGYLSSVFKEQAGVNFADYLEGIRIKQARELLKDTSITVSDIAERVGYNSVQAFRRAFKRVTGKSPKEVRSEEQPFI